MKNTADSKLTVKFVFQVSLNGGSYADIASVDAPYSKGGENVSASYTIPTGIESIRFRVYAKDSSGFSSSNYLYSDTTTFGKYTISVNASPASGGTVTGGGAFTEGTSVTVRATASSHYTFTGWRENGTIVSTSAAYTFTVSADRSLTAVFQEEAKYAVTAEVSPPGGGTVTGTGSFYSGTDVTLRASPAEGYEFVCWTKENGSIITTSPTLTFTVNMNYHQIAVFKQKLALWVGVNGKARKGVELYVGVNGKARRVVEGYIGVNGKARRFL